MPRPRCKVYNSRMTQPEIASGIPAVYGERRARLAQLMQRGVAVVPTAPEQARNRDSHYPYRYDSYFYYLTGFPEPEAVLVLVAGDPVRSILFCRDRDAEREIWDGFRYGLERARTEFHFDESHSISELDTVLPKLLGDQSALHCHLGSDGRWDERVLKALNAVRAQLNFRLLSDAMKNDVQQAAAIQQSLLPSSPPFIAGYETAGRSQPAEVVGGDFFDFSIFDDEVFSVAVGDASGHGLPAALLVRDVVTGLRMGVEKEMKMAEAMQKLNRVIHRSTLSARFISLFFAEIESTGDIFYVNAGHPPPLLVHGSQVKHLKATGLILGAVSEILFHRASASFEPGAVLLMYSDGVLERRNSDGEEFGLPQLEELLIQHQQKSALMILEAIYETIFAFGDRAKWEDDVTVVVIKKLAS